ncbi:MAG: hypothetical protein KDB23_03455 [Planctomycetales bacterium]|nr:hypothetical protein [Planctomycetales bacterium]
MSTRLAWLLAATIYVLLLIAISFGLREARRWATVNLVTPTAHDNWEQFRGDIREQAERGGPVKRRVPVSTEPPLLVLLRDHFVACLVISIVLSSALYGTLAVFVVGALGRRPDDEHAPAGVDVADRT